jgi:hypothetical protein
LIRLSSNPKVHQVIDNIFVDIPKVYGLFFSIDWSHLWIPKNGQPNKIRINRERYLKYTVTNMNDPNEPFFTAANLIETQGMNTFFGNFMNEISFITNP